MKEWRKLFIWSLAIALVIAFVPAVWGTEEAHKGEHEVPAAEVEQININTASANELTNLKGVGEKYAQAIIRYRREHGPFAQAEDIMKVHGIGPKTLENNKHCITVE